MAGSLRDSLQSLLVIEDSSLGRHHVHAFVWVGAMLSRLLQD